MGVKHKEARRPEKDGRSKTPMGRLAYIGQLVRGAQGDTGQRADTNRELRKGTAGLTFNWQEDSWMRDEIYPGCHRG